MRTGDSWYQGTADAVYQNIDLIRRSGAKNVVILSGDRIYRMDYADMIRQHEDSHADVTVACMEVERSEAHSFGVMSIAKDNRIYGFQEKPMRPKPLPGSPHRSLASMGICVFSSEMLCRELEADHADIESSHDFGKDLLPRLIHSHQVSGYRFGNHEGQNYWRDAGTIDAYYQANMDLLKESPPFDLQDAQLMGCTSFPGSGDGSYLLTRQNRDAGESHYECCRSVDGQYRRADTRSSRMLSLDNQA